MRADLQSVLGQAYRAKAMGQGDIATAMNAFNQHRDDAGFMAAARAELARVTAVPNRQCFVSKLTMDFLKEAING